MGTPMSQPLGAASAQFVTIVLGASSGLHEANLTAYLLAPIGERQFIALDAGTVLSGLLVATSVGSFADIQVPHASALTLDGLILREHIKAYVSVPCPSGSYQWAHSERPR